MHRERLGRILHYPARLLPGRRWAKMNAGISEVKKKHSNPRWELENLSDELHSIYPMKPIFMRVLLVTISL